MLFNDDDLFAEMGTLLGLSNPEKGCTLRYSVPSFPPAKIFVDKENNFCLNFALAGYSKDDLNISFKGDLVEVSTSDKFNKKNAEEGLAIKKMVANNFKRPSFSYTYVVPEDTDKDKTSASFKDGVLSIVIPAKPKNNKHNLNITIN